MALNTLARIIKWALENDIAVNVAPHKEEGLSEQIKIAFLKNGKVAKVKLQNWEELERPLFKTMVQDAAFSLCLTRLEL